jgi:hypothetical protein
MFAFTRGDLDKLDMQGISGLIRNWNKAFRFWTS